MRKTAFKTFEGIWSPQKLLGSFVHNNFWSQIIKLYLGGPRKFIIHCNFKTKLVARKLSRSKSNEEKWLKKSNYGGDMWKLKINMRKVKTPSLEPTIVLIIGSGLVFNSVIFCANVIDYATHMKLFSKSVLF